MQRYKQNWETFSKRKITEELTKCISDYAYAIKNYCHIVIPGRGISLFNMYDYQERVLNTMIDNQDTIILKSRQLGITTTVAAFIALEMCFKENYEALVIATTQSKAITCIRKVRTALKNMPSWMKPKINIDNAMSLELANGSVIKAMPSTEDAGRSDSLSILVIDEAAWIKNADGVWTGASETLSTSGGKSVLLSTPNGIGNLFHKIWVGAENGENGFANIVLNWNVHPNRDENWKKERIKKLGARGFEQEHGCSFLSSGNTVIDGSIIRELEKKYKTPVKMLGPKNNLWIWNYPKSGKKYLIGADTAIGGEGDYCAAHVLDLETLAQCAEFRGRITPNEFGHLLVSLATQYNNALLTIENNGIGMATIQVALDENYKNLFWSLKGTLEYIDITKTPKKILQDRNARPGFNTNNKTRTLIIQKLQDYLNDQSIEINSKRFISELWTFIWKGAKAIAEKGYHDDLIMSYAIALWVHDTALRLETAGIAQSKQRLNWITYSPNLSKENTSPVYTTSDKDPHIITIYGNETMDLRELMD